MDDKHPDSAPPPYTDSNEQLTDIANVPRKPEPNVKWTDRGAVFSDSVMEANQELKYFEDYDKRDPRVDGVYDKRDPRVDGVSDRGECFWQHCNNSHPHRHFWARDIYKVDVEKNWGKAFQGIAENCGWKKCTKAKEGHWHTSMAMNQDALRLKFYEMQYLYPSDVSTGQELVLAITATGFFGHVWDRINGKGNAEFEKKFEDYGWIREGYTEEKYKTRSKASQVDGITGAPSSGSV